MNASLPLGKLPPELLARLLTQAPIQDPRVLYGPGIGRDCAVIALDDDPHSRVLVLKSDPITFATAEIGWYAVQVNANDIATTGANPRWMLATLLLPEKSTTPQLVESIFNQLTQAAAGLGIALVGGHTEITYGLDRPILVGTLIGEVERDRLVIPGGARPGDRLLLTKGVPIEATALLAKEFPHRLQAALSSAEIEQARNFLYHPGISVVRDARIAARAGRVTAMHDPTEGGLASALWELAEASGVQITIDPAAVPVPPLAARVCEAFGLNPLAAIASGALLLAVAPSDAAAICSALAAEGIPCAAIGHCSAGSPFTVRLPDGTQLLRPPRDEITRVFEQQDAS